MADARIRGLYAITPDETDADALARKVEAALRGGARVIQYRNKRVPRVEQPAQVRLLLQLTRRMQAPLIVNDDVELALETGADGVHLGREDGDLARARSRLGPGRLLGASCYDRLELAEAALRAGADHVAFGSVFGSPTKPGAVRAPLTLFTEARAKWPAPLVAIGGITPANAPPVIAAGAHALAVISAVFDAPDVESAARRFSALFDNQRG